MLWVQGNKISFQYAGEESHLLDDISFYINSRSRCAVVGDNGCGKSTLFKIILGKITDYKGEVVFDKKDEIIGFLPQEIRFNESLTVEEYLFEARFGLWKIKQKIDQDVTDVDAYLQYEELGGYDFELLIEKNALKFGFNNDFLNREVATLSGGEKTKLALFKVVLISPDLLLLDEPTNHLDVETLDWLENYLTSCEIPFLVISHDRKFLDKCVSQIWLIENKKLRVFSGNYSFYKKEMEIEKKRLNEEYLTQNRKIKQLKKAAIDRKQWAISHQPQTGRNGYAPVYESITNFAEKAMKRAKNVEKRIEMMIEKEEKNKPFVEKTISLLFNQNEKAKSKIILTIENLTKRFSKDLFFPINLNVEMGSRVAIRGKNGSGKSTFLKIIMGLIEPSSGRVYIPPSIKLSYYSQEYEKINLENSIINEVVDGDFNIQTHARTILGCMGLKRDKVLQKIKTLSIGERSKVALAKTILSGANVLLLDEPTNHLEIKSREVIEQALREFKGTIIFVSHDRMFVEKLATCVFDLEKGSTIISSHPR